MLIAFFAILGLVGMFIGVYRAGMEDGLWPGIEWIMSRWWGKATLLDLYISFVLISFWIAFTEKNKALAAFWIINIFWAGSFASLFFLVMRCFRAKTVRDVFVPS
jgi:hypothetical protein